MNGDSQTAGRPVSKPVAERAAAGKAARRAVPRTSHAGWDPPANRPDPMSVISAQETGRLPWLLPVRHTRMAESPFAFYRGCAALMAADLAGTPSMGVPVQLCGDAHLANFGTFASPERRQVFDVNDFDETLPGPWEWDVKRLATSFVLAARDDGFDDTVGRAAAVRSVSAYRNAMAKFTTTSVLDVWYAQVSLDLLRAALPAGDRKRFDQGQRKARQRTSQQALAKLAEEVDGELRMRSDPPLLVPLRDLAAIFDQGSFDQGKFDQSKFDQGKLRAEVWDSYDSYLSSIGYDRRHVLSRFEPVDVALKVVGVGSVGTRCFIVLLRGLDRQEPLFLQVKEATNSVLEAHLAPSGYQHCGQRVVEGQRLMQASSDIFLGWSKTATGPHYYWRQFRDMKGSFDIALMDPGQLSQYAEACGWTLAHCHARAGDAVMIAAYLGSSATFDEAVGDFAVAYADQTTRDHAAFVDAVAAVVAVDTATGPAAARQDAGAR